MEHIAFAIVAFLLIGLTILREREYVRHRKREAALTDQVIQLASTKRWEDYTELRKQMFLAEVDARKSTSENTNGGDMYTGVPPELRNQF